MEKALKTVMIVGLPNSGKSQLYNDLTGEYTLVSNYPLTTVEPRAGKGAIDGVEWKIVDTPGLHGLFIQSEEERIVRDTLFQEKPDLLIQCMDANGLKQSLGLTADLSELGVPLVIYLNAIGDGRKRGIKVDADGLSRRLGVPVVESPGPGAGRNQMIAAMRNARVLSSSPVYGDELDGAIDRISRLLPNEIPFKTKTAILLIEGDRGLLSAIEGEALSGIEGRLLAERRDVNGKAARLIGDYKNRWINDVSAGVVLPVPRSPGRFSEEFARLCRHPVFGLPILAVFLGLLYVAVVYCAGFLSIVLSTTIVEPLVDLAENLLPDGFWEDMLVGPYGLLTLGLFNAIFTVLPILSVFFLLFGAMEDIGYLPNLTILSRRLLGKIGITGNSIIPLVLGFGCKTMATLTTRSLHSRKEKIIVIFLIAFAIPCSAQLGLNMAILGRYGPQHFLTTIAILSLVEIAAGLVLNAIIPAEPSSRFIQELPPIRLPNLSAVLKKTGYRLLWFLREAIPIFLIASASLFILDASGVLGGFKRLIEPVITGWLGLPLDMADALIVTMARHEAAAGMILHMSRGGLLDGVQSIIAVTITTMFVPCIANIVAMIRELGLKAGLAIALSINVSSFMLAGAFLRLLRLLQGGLGL
jgi:ferrous iron transport protein B